MSLEPNIRIIKSFIDRPASLLAMLRDGITWDEKMRARKSGSFGIPYNYPGMTYPQVPMLPELLPICDRIWEALSFYPNNCLVNYYPDSSSYMGFHYDATEELSERSGITIVSLGAARPIVFRHRQDSAREISFDFHSGDLLYMPHSVQAEWLHGIPKASAAVAERISLTFREIVKGEESGIRG